MNMLVAIILGFVEGATEFLPVSSSGHLIIARRLLGAELTNSLSFDAVLQFSASLALLVFFYRDILNLIIASYNWIIGKSVSVTDKVYLKAIVIGTIPAVIFGLLLEEKMETAFRNIDLVALTLILGSILFWVAQKVAKENQSLTLGRGVLVGLFQSLALVPGISRSGATISGGLIAGLTKEEAVRFSFLLSIPIIFGAGLKKLLEVREELEMSGFGVELFVGSFVAFMTGVIAIHFFIKYLRNNDLTVFIIYRIGLAIAIFLIF